MPPVPDDPSVIRLREYLEFQIRSLETRLSQRLDLEQRAVQKAEESLVARLDGLNELRGAMRDQTNLFVVRSAFDAKWDSVVDRVAAIEVRVANWEGRVAVVTALTATAVSVVVGLIMLWIAPK